MSKPKIEKNIQIPDEIIRELLTPSEKRMLKNRFLILKLLEEKLPIRQIAEKVKVGTDTVVRVSRMVDRGQLKKVKTQPKITWVFGKSEAN